MKPQLEQLETRDCPSADPLDRTMAAYQMASTNIANLCQTVVRSTLPVYGASIRLDMAESTPTSRAVNGKCANVFRLVDRANLELSLARQSMDRYYAAEDDFARAAARTDFLSHIRNAATLAEKAVQILISTKKAGVQ